MADSKNSFTYEWRPWPASYFRWKVLIGEYCLTGEANTHRQMIRRVKRAVRRHRKMEKLINGK